MAEEHRALSDRNSKKQATLGGSSQLTGRTRTTLLISF
ncbi:hypothetical protein Nizo1840_0764 [Lactiplantibacillus plantarum]|jgi:hypothetical protein|nr:hypothetical protein Nizo1839_2736 [Lactiplantibacillus plantarum]KZT87261.1 hypothetical protein Nizo1840_0764 [Lactiplantibacillus plantarum]